MTRFGILALDISSSRTGWAMERRDDVPLLGYVPFGAGAHGFKGCLYIDWFAPFLRMQNPERVIYEAPLPPQAQTHANTARLLFGLGFTTEVICERFGFPVSEERADKVRVHFCNHGHAKKPAIIAECKARGWHVPDDDDNAADAGALLSLAVSLYRKSNPGLVGARGYSMRAA